MGSLITEEKLHQAKQLWQKEFASLPHPWTALIIGGSIKGKPFTQENAQTLADKVKELKNNIGGSLLVTDSRRTGTEAETLIMDTLKDIPAHTFLWGSKGKKHARQRKNKTGAD